MITLMIGNQIIKILAVNYDGHDTALIVANNRLKRISRNELKLLLSKGRFVDIDKNCGVVAHPWQVDAMKWMEKGEKVVFTPEDLKGYCYN